MSNTNHNPFVHTTKNADGTYTIRPWTVREYRAWARESRVCLHGHKRRADIADDCARAWAKNEAERVEAERVERERMEAERVEATHERENDEHADRIYERKQAERAEAEAREAEAREAEAREAEAREAEAHSHTFSGIVAAMHDGTLDATTNTLELLTAIGAPADDIAVARENMGIAARATIADIAADLAREFAIDSMTDADALSRGGYVRGRIVVRVNGVVVFECRPNVTRSRVTPVTAIMREAGRPMWTYDERGRAVLDRENLDYAICNYSTYFKEASASQIKRGIYYAARTADGRIARMVVAGADGRPRVTAVNFGSYVNLYREAVRARVNLALDRQGWNVARNIVTTVVFERDHMEK